ncbi:MAG TPA: antibiotic biosynthesis monooxygenase [Actinomycetales bacterium]|nr:antibiotic biosynthesis monooxygenase [Actinomycetales bacterium]
MLTVYVRVWEYEVAPEHVDAFLAAYGSEGPWARLFRQGSGYVGTDLFRLAGGGGRFLTVDRWVDEDSWTRFLDRFREAYEALDARLEGLAANERPLVAGNG